MRAAMLFAATLLAAESTPTYEVGAPERVMVEMRDGARLATILIRPVRAGQPVAGRLPVILNRTPYGTTRLERTASYFVSRGYVVVGQNVRGRYGSEGNWRCQVDDPQDGYDTAAWIGRQAWYLPESEGGGIGTIGTSYEGATQHALALGGAPNLKTMIPVDSMSNYGKFGVRHNGAFELRFFNWIFSLGNSPSPTPEPKPPGHYPTGDPNTRDLLAGLAARVPEYVRALPLRPGTTPLRLAPDYERWLIEAMSHGDYDDYWKNSGASVVDHLSEYKDLPILHVTGWYDTWTAQVANMNFVELSRAKKSSQRLLIGPWVHGGQTGHTHGEADFGKDAGLDFDAVRLRWFEHHLRGVKNGVESDPAVRIFVMGPGQSRKTPEGLVMVGGRWRDEREWPLARAVSTPYYLHSDGTLHPGAPKAGNQSTTYTFDPRDPVPTIGGSLSSEGLLAPRGAMDQRCRPSLWACRGSSMRLSQRTDVLSFRTEPLASDTEVTGPLLVKLWIASSAVDTDFTAKLIDVYPPSSDFPDGVELNVSDSILRARYRKSLAQAEMLKPGEMAAITIEMYPTSLVFGKGHRIRLDISSSNFPRFDVNPNTGEPLNANRRWTIAENTVFHDSLRPSHIVLPVVAQ